MKELWYEESAADWNEALPLGNGFMGAMCFGGPVVDRFLLNADSLWFGSFKDRVNPDAKRTIPKVQKLLGRGKIAEAEKLANEGICAIGDSMCHYEPLGDLFFFSTEQPLEVFGIKDRWNPALYDMTDATDYKRELDLLRGICRVSYMRKGKPFMRESFVSYPDRVMVIFAKGEPGFVTFERGAYFGTFQKLDQNTLAFMGQVGPDGVTYALVLRAIRGGCKIIGKNLHVEEESVLLLSVQTGFYAKDPLASAKQYVEHAMKYSYEELKRRHSEDVAHLMKRCELSLEADCDEERASCLNHLSTLKRLNRMKEGKEDSGLVNLLFSYGRYLLVASSRPGSLPANLQGIWNQDYLPMWDSKYTININLQMNYWPAEVTNLSDLHEPLFAHIKRMWPRGKRVAKQMYGARGWMAHHNTDLWGDCAPQDMYAPATYWQMGAAWLCLHLLEHYRFTKDEVFLASYLPLIKEAALFFEDTLIEDADGNLVVSPTVSPENTYRLPNGEAGNLCEGASMDAQILYELFEGLLETNKISIEERNRYEQILHKLPKTKLNPDGTIMEWVKPYEETQPGHRHISHLFALYPGRQFCRESRFMEPAKKTLAKRLFFGGGHTGWSRAWIINLWARLCEGDKAYENILALMRQSLNNNLLDDHPPFQIDGNFGLVSGIAEMLLQSHKDQIVLLPALPQSWRNGAVTGLKARGNITVSIWWKDGKAERAELLSKSAQKVDVCGFGEVLLLPGEKKTLLFCEKNGTHAESIAIENFARKNCAINTNFDKMIQKSDKSYKNEYNNR